MAVLASSTFQYRKEIPKAQRFSLARPRKQNLISDGHTGERQRISRVTDQLRSQSSPPAIYSNAPLDLGHVAVTNYVTWNKDIPIPPAPAMVQEECRTPTAH